MNYHMKTGLRKLVDILTIVIILVVSDYSPLSYGVFSFKVPLYFIDSAVFVFFLYEIIHSFGAYQFFYSKSTSKSIMAAGCLLWRVITGRTSQINA